MASIKQVMTAQGLVGQEEILVTGFSCVPNALTIWQEATER